MNVLSCYVLQHILPQPAIEIIKKEELKYKWKKLYSEKVIGEIKNIKWQVDIAKELYENYGIKIYFYVKYIYFQYNLPIFLQRKYKFIILLL